MKKHLAVFILVIFASCLFGSEMDGGFIGFSFGGISCDTDDLNERFNQIGIDEIDDMVYSWGGEGYGIVTNVLFGFSGAAAGIKTESDSMSIKVDINYWLFEAGYLFSITNKIALIPMFGIGSRGIRLYARPDLGDIDFDEILTPTGAGRTTTINSGGIVGSVGLGALFRLGSFIMFYAKGNYLRQFGGDWNLEDGAMLRNEPEFGFKGPSFSVGIVLGGLSATEK